MKSASRSPKNRPSGEGTSVIPGAVKGDDPGVAARASRTGEEMRWSVAAVARALGVAPATLRTWDRRYGVGPSGHREGQHRRYTEADLGRLETMRRLLLQGVSTAEAARAATTAQREEGPPPQSQAPMTGSALRRPERPRPRPANMTVRQLREAALRLDADRIAALLTRAVDEHGVPVVWETLLRPVLSWIGDRWADDVDCIATEHLLTECATRVLHQAMRGRVRPAHRPVLLLCAPGEAHVLPLHALAAALEERSVPGRLLGAATPAGATMAAARRLQPSAIVVWAQSPQTADPEVFAALPPARGGRLVVAAGPGWAQTHLPPSVTQVDSLPAALGLLAGDLS
jgi:MerR family transcriptional regulator, light-induced transcriptional regulator